MSTSADVPVVRFETLFEQLADELFLLEAWAAAGKAWAEFRELGADTKGRALTDKFVNRAKSLVHALASGSSRRQRPMT